MRVQEGRVTKQPFAARETCGNGHPWRTETTRWRRRTRKGGHRRGGEHEIVTIERDCLICKQVSEGERRRLTVRGRRYL